MSHMNDAEPTTLQSGPYLQVEPLDMELTAWTPDEAAQAFAERYSELDAKRSAGATNSK
jgi:hypothetical protein